MIPLWDETRRPVNFPIVTAGIIAVNVFCFILELIGGNSFVLRWSVTPSDIAAGRHLETIITAMFMHGGWGHIIGNMVFLWAFGPEVEDSMGPWRYLAFYLAAGIVATLAQVAAMPASTVPNLGASGAIAGVMGAFLVTYPRDKIHTILVLGFFVTSTALPAALLIGLWFLIQLFSAGVGAIAHTDSSGVAYTAHVAGALFGAATAWLFEDRTRLGENAAE
jgi:membrane associated rhomboid family serine protease